MTLEQLLIAWGNALLYVGFVAAVGVTVLFLALIAYVLVSDFLARRKPGVYDWASEVEPEPAFNFRVRRSSPVEATFGKVRVGLDQDRSLR